MRTEHQRIHSTLARAFTCWFAAVCRVRKPVSGWLLTTACTPQQGVNPTPVVKMILVKIFKVATPPGLADVLTAECFHGMTAGLHICRWLAVRADHVAFVSFS
jgi:hypothetical protein